MDDSIKRSEEKQDKPRRRLEEFIDQRYPGGVPPVSSPVEERSANEVAEEERRRKKSKRNTK
jgi:hypothetical protein